MYIHLTTHSAYSLQEGLALPVELAQAAAADDMPALGLTDHRLLSGSVEFVTACRKAGVVLGGILVDSAKLINQALPEIASAQHRKEIEQYCGGTEKEPYPS